MHFETPGLCPKGCGALIYLEHPHMCSADRTIELPEGLITDIAFSPRNSNKFDSALERLKKYMRTRLLTTMEIEVNQESPRGK